MASIESIIGTKFNSVQHKAMLNVIYTGNWFIRLHNRVLKEYNISQQQYNVLRILRGAKTFLNMMEIRKKMLDPTPNLTRLTEKLISKELVVKVRSNNDRRHLIVKISEKGLALLDTLDKVWVGDFAPEKKLTDDEALLLNQILDKIRDHE